MKKSLLSVVLCVALLITAMGTMLAMPASAASGIDFLATGSVAGNDATPAETYSVENGVLTFTATAADQEVAITIEGEANLNEFPYTELVISSDVDFDIAFYDKANNKWMFGAGDFCYNFGDGLQASKPLPAGDYDVKFTLTGAYTWTGDPLPATAAVKSITFIAKAPGTITVSKCQMTDGMLDVDMNTRGDQSATTWADSVNLIAGEYKDAPAPSAEDPQSSVKVTKNDDGSVTYGNTNGQYPAAAYTFAEPVVVNRTAALELDFTVSAGSQTAIYVYMGTDTPDNFGNKSYVYVVNLDDVLTTDLPTGNYKGVMFLDDILSKSIGEVGAEDKCFNADGNYVINGVKVYAINNNGATDNAVTVRKLNLVSLANEAEMPSTTAKQDKTTTTLGAAQTTAANGDTATTTVNKGDSNGGNSASTGDVSDAALFIVVAAAAAAVVTLSVVASKKAKSR